MIKTAAILCTIFEEIVEEEQLPVLNDHLIKLDLVPTNLITNIPHAIPPKNMCHHQEKSNQRSLPFEDNHLLKV